MNNLLIWSLSHDDKLVFSSFQASLATITCCDSITVTLKVNQAEYQLFTDLKGCALTTFKQDLLKILHKKELKAELLKNIEILRSSLGQILIQIKSKDVVLAYFLTDFEVIQTWISQLELLEIVMQENENEKKSRGSGCC